MEKETEYLIELKADVKFLIDKAERLEERIEKLEDAAPAAASDSEATVSMVSKLLAVFLDKRVAGGTAALVAAAAAAWEYFKDKL